MKVLHVITGLAAGGAEHQLRLLLRYLPHECEVATLTNPGAVARAIEAGGTRVHDLGMRGNRDLSVLPRLVRLIRDGRFDVVHTHLYRACLYGRLAARLAGVRYVLATEHSLGTGVIEGRPAGAGVRALYLASERLGRSTIAVSGTVADRLVAWGVHRDRVRVVPNGLDLAELRYDRATRLATRAALGIPAGVPVVGGVGRLAATKRFDLLIGALAGLPPETVLLLAGDGDQRTALAELARRRGVADRVVFAGATAHAREVLCAMDVFASPSEQETFGLAVLEALGNGLPAVYVTCPPLDEHPDPVPGACRVAPDEQALGAALRTELDRLAGRDGARLPVPDLLHRFDVAALAARIGRIYHDMAAARRPAAWRLIEGDAS
jgi:glycosyltransferase involved in cell wall biosynthesis